MWVLIDNYDSFTYILHHYLLLTGNECSVYRNDEITIAQLHDLAPSRIIISPGPGTPTDAGITMDVVHHFHQTVPILGICLGHQALGMYFGANLKHAPQPVHGKTSDITHNGHPVFKDIPSPFTVMRYHSLSLQTGSNTICELAHTADGTLMALTHPNYPCMGFQFHPESVGTGYGMQLLKNWTSLVY